MKIKELFLLPTIVACLTAVSTSCYGNNAMGKTTNGNGSQDSEIMQPSAPTPGTKATPPTTSNAYSNSGSSYTNGYSKSKNYTNGSSSSYTNGGNSCSTMDISVFEEADEENVYSTFGFTRGDIKNLYIYKYDPRSEQLVIGNIEKILRVQFPDGNCYLVAVIKTTSGDVLANLGPVWFADENNLVINEGDQVQITGSLVRTNGRYIIIASQFKKGPQSLVLRNQSGNPQWGAPKSQKGTNGN
jgi:hypothetical protein